MVAPCFGENARVSVLHATETACFPKGMNFQNWKIQHIFHAYMMTSPWHLNLNLRIPHHRVPHLVMINGNKRTLIWIPCLQAVRRNQVSLN